MHGDAATATTLTLDAGQLERTFPFFLHVDERLRVQATGPSLRKLLPDLPPGADFHAHFEVSQPAGASDGADWRARAGTLVVLRSRAQAGLLLRGTVETSGTGLFFLVTAVATSLDGMRQLGLGLRDYALHDSLAGVLRSRPASGAALRREVEQLRAIVELGDSGVLYAAPSGEVLHVNRTLCQMLGIDDSRVAGLTLDAFELHLGEVLAPEETERQPLSALLDRLLQDPGGPDAAPWSHTLRLVSPRRVTLLMSLTLTPARDLVLYFRDITRESEVDRMKSEFLSTAAHELRTPLASIFGFAELMLTRKMAPEQQREVLQTVHRQAQLLINLINELLDLSRIESRQGKDFHRQLCRVGTIIDQTLRGLLVTAQCAVQRFQVFAGRRRHRAGYGAQERGRGTLRRHARDRPGPGHDDRAAGARLRPLLACRSVRQHSRYRLGDDTGQGDYRAAGRPRADRKHAA